MTIPTISDKQNITTLGTASFLGEYDKDAAYNWAFNVEYPVVTYNGASYIAIDQPEVGQLPDENPKVWQLLGKFKGGGDKLKFKLPLKYNEQGEAEIFIWDYAFAVAGEPEDKYSPPKGSLCLGQEFLEDLRGIDDCAIEAYDLSTAAMEVAQSAALDARNAGNVAEAAQKTATAAEVLAKAAIKTINAKTTDTVKMTAKANGDGSVDLSAELVNPSPSPTPSTAIDLYNFDVGLLKVEFDPNIIPAVKSFMVKKPFPAKAVYISIPRIMDTFYHDADALCVCTNLSAIDTTLTDRTTKVKVAADCIAYDRPYTSGMDPKKIFINNEWVSFQIDVTKILADMSLCNDNRVLITVTPAKEPPKAGTMPAFPIWIDDEGSTLWKKNNLLGCSQTVLTDTQAFLYDYRAYKTYGNGELVYNLDLSTNQFTSPNWTRRLIFKDTASDALRSDFNLVVNMTAKGKLVSSPYTTMINADSYKFVLPIPKTNPAIKIITLVCVNNNVLIY